MNDSTWKTLEQSADSLKRLSENRAIPYYEREKLAREARDVQELARKAREQYVHWLWGY